MDGDRIHLPVVSSTNIYTNALLSHSGIAPWTIVSADFQTKGKGQRGKGWHSDAGLNLLFSVALKADIQIDKQAQISMATSLALVSTLGSFGIDAEIKWPNDILVNGKKIAGILIENQLRENRVEWSVVGVGLNVNQFDFPKFDWEATSMKAVIGSKSALDLESVLEHFKQSFKQTWGAFIEDDSKMLEAFNGQLFGRGKLALFDQNDKICEGTVVGVNRHGALELELEGRLQSFVNGSIKMKRSDPESPNQVN